MKFRCKMDDAGAMRDFTNVATTIARMSKQCVLRLTQDAVYFNAADESTPMVWTRLDQAHFFREYLVEGKSEQFNEIYMELNTAMLSKSASTIKNSAKSVKIKLTNKQQACITFAIELPSISAESRLCVHDIPVTIVSQKRWSEYNEPHYDKFDISLQMPQFKHLRSVMERIKNMSPVLELAVDTNGTLAFKADADSATITVHFPSLTVYECNATDETIMASVDIKKFHAFLAWDAVHPSYIKCHIIHNRVIHISLELDSHLQIKYYIPAVDNPS